MSDDNIILVLEGVRVFGAYRDQLFAAMQRLGWRQSAGQWFAPEDTQPHVAFDQLLREVRPVEGMRPEDLEDAMEGQDPENERCMARGDWSLRRTACCVRSSAGYMALLPADELRQAA